MLESSWRCPVVVRFDELKTVPTADAAHAALQRAGRRQARQARQTAERREQLLEVAFELFQSVGLAGFNMREMAQRAGYTPGALYAYFDGKDAILAALRHRLFEQLGAQLAAARPPRAPRTGGRVQASPDPALDALEAARGLWLAQCSAWWHWLATPPQRLRLLLRMDDPIPDAAPVEGVQAPPALEQWLVANQVWGDSLQQMLGSAEAARTLHEEVLAWGLGLLVLQVATPGEPGLQARFEQTLPRWLDRALGDARPGQRPQADLFG